MRRVAWLSLICGLLSVSSAFAECAPRPEKACELANHEGPIITATVLGSAQPGVLPSERPYMWRVRVDRSFRGALRGNVEIMVMYGDGSGPASLSVGDQLLLYVTPNLPDGSDGLFARLGCGASMWLKWATMGELTFLERLGRRAHDGHIFGEVSGYPPSPPPVLFGGVRITARNGKRSYSTSTAADGTFDIGGLPPGSYVLSADVPVVRETGQTGETDDDPIILQPHGCYESDIELRANTRISGRIRLPDGVRLEDTLVTAMTVTGRQVDSASADPLGRYAIVGLDPGEYVVAINPPLSVSSPFPLTYAPRTPDIGRARKISLTAPGVVPNVDIDIPTASPIATVAFSGVMEDGAPAADAVLRLIANGRNEIQVARTNVDGTATVRVVTGTSAYLLGSMKDRCMVPIRLGPDMYPPTLRATFTEDGCREQDNLSQGTRLGIYADDGMTHVPVRVTLSDGSPAYRAKVTVISRSPDVPFVVEFRTDKTGFADLAAPAGTVFTVDTTFDKGSHYCGRVSVWVDTRDGIRWQVAPASGAPDWKDVPVTSTEVPLRLPYPVCKAG